MILHRNSELWWKHNRELLNRKSKTASFSPLQGPAGNKVADAKGRADLIATALCSEFVSPEPVCRRIVEAPLVTYQVPASIRTRIVVRVMEAIGGSSATGPDAVSGRVLKECRYELAPIIAGLVKHILLSGSWPDIWRFHWLHPLYKNKGSVLDPLNYRGIHLTYMCCPK